MELDELRKQQYQQLFYGSEKNIKKFCDLWLGLRMHWTKLIGPQH